ncbi:hypothetical protein WJX84_000427 [Apatococcus fuscideae]|uniref:Peptidase M14 domain-containing protein n=1 Tax=Apatococcus fuscideae TaxID=2026836 RepID=A0AAW1TCE5_9CHLO
MKPARRLFLGYLILSANCFLLHAQVPWDVYHKTDEIVGFFQAAAAEQPSRVRLEQHIDEATSDRLPVVTITDFASGEAGKEVLLLVAGEHGRELITSDIIYWLGKALSGKAEELLHWPTMQQVLSKAQVGTTGLKGNSLELWLEGLLQKCIFKIVPVANIAARKQVEGGLLCQRTTPSGVDLNRNWPHAWKLEEAGQEEYGGPKPLSEPQTRIVKALATAAQPRAFVNLHSGEYALYVPWDSQPTQAAGLPADMDQVLDKLNVFCQCMHGAGGKVAGYLAFGTSMDYLYQELQVPYPLTVEVYGPGGTGKLATGGKPRQLLSSPAEVGAELQERWQRPHSQGFGRGLQQQLSQQQTTQLQMAQQQADQQASSQQQQQAAEMQKPLQQAAITQAGVAGQDAASGQGLAAQGAATQAGIAQGAGAQASGDSQLSMDKCFRDFNPVSREGYQDVVATWLAALLTLAEHLAANPRASLLKNDADQHQLPIPPVPPFKQDLAAMAGTDSDESLSQTAGMGDFRSKAVKGKQQPDSSSRAHVSLLETAPAASHLLRRLLILGGLGLLVTGIWMKMGSPVAGLMHRRRSSLGSRRTPRAAV